jgi:hypothetical protein
MTHVGCAGKRQDAASTLTARKVCKVCALHERGVEVKVERSNRRED